MKALGEVELELSRLGIHNRFVGKPEVKELANILAPDEAIIKASNGRYTGGLAMLVITDRRLLLIDKKMWYLSLEDVRFDMISELDYCARLMDATLTVRTINKVLNFTSWHQKHLRELTSYLQDKIMELRHLTVQAQEQMAAGIPQPQLEPQHQPIPQSAQQPINRQEHYVFDAEPPVVSNPQPVVQNQQFSSQISPQPRSRLKRIGAYPTASLTMNRRFSR